MADNRLKTKAIHNWMSRAGWYSPSAGPIHVPEKMKSSKYNASIPSLSGEQERKRASHVINNQKPNRRKKKPVGLSGKTRRPKYGTF